MAPAKARWGDDPDSSDEESEVGLVQEPTPAPAATSEPSSAPEKTAGGITVPPTHTSRIDSKGIKIVTSYRADPANPNRLLKTTTKIRVTYDKVSENVAVAARRKWKKFGQAAVDEDQSNVTIQSRDDIFMEDPNADVDLQDEDVGKAIAGNLNAFWAKQNMRNLQRKYDVDGDDAGKGEGGAEDGWTQVGAGGSGGGGNKYVPPSARGGSGGMGGKSLSALAAGAPDSGGGDRRNDNRDQNTIRVTNISEDTTEADLQELFQPFGRISRVYLAKDKETMQSRGFAFVSFVHREDAARAMDKLQGHGYDHLILKLEWARPSAPKDPATSGTQFRSGYGKALAQDTKEKVSYASNLTTGVR
eukprot:CAMPEP_0183705078 /NCGR_PEP_ID=MMETSP0737-20130205/2250_1 /TAXON_ID=385413 /ORGANISM="Thalassiosira miniscula, Strain CCMP1093" /LENGTH=359 /DNA_ID=CAMNT_0025932143 /DNA_START=57 /DNA_END=1136 /DNA_ORIENTATION=-